MKSPRDILRRVGQRAREAVHEGRFRASLRHLHGPDGVSVAPDQVVAVVLVRDGMFYMDRFLEHYRRLGVAQFVFCDNGSTDGTIERLRQEPDTVILQSTMKWGEIENDFRRHAAERFAQDRWCLIIDMDEMLEFEGAGTLGLAGLTAYLAQEGYTALVAQMLEMFPKVPIRAAARMDHDEVLEEFIHYDLRETERCAYHDADKIAFSYFLQSNILANPDIPFLFGGTRARVFGERCCLTKHPLVHVSGALEPGVHPHCAAHARVADVTALIRHYKFANDPVARDEDSLNRGAIPHGENRARLRIFDVEPDTTLYSADAARFCGLGALIDAGFLSHSARFDGFRAARRG